MDQKGLRTASSRRVLAESAPPSQSPAGPFLYTPSEPGV